MTGHPPPGRVRPDRLVPRADRGPGPDRARDRRRLRDRPLLAGTSCWSRPTCSWTAGTSGSIATRRATSATRRWRSTSRTSPRWRACRSPRWWRWPCPATAPSRWRRGSTPGWPRWPSASRSTWWGATPTPGTARSSSASRCWARPPPAARSAARRARPGDAILVTGPLGGSLLGRHLRPEPRVAEALVLHHEAPLHALIDISDGLASDLAPHPGGERRARGGPRRRLDPDPPRRPDDEPAGRAPALDHALHDGEDFELCLVVAPDDADRLVQIPAPLRRRPPRRHDHRDPRPLAPGRRTATCPRSRHADSTTCGPGRAEGADMQVQSASRRRA